MITVTARKFFLYNGPRHAGEVFRVPSVDALILQYRGLIAVTATVPRPPGVEPDPEIELPPLPVVVPTDPEPDVPLPEPAAEPEPEGTVPRRRGVYRRRATEGADRG